MSAPDPSLRIGDVAKLAGTTPRTIRYYEEIGLLPEILQRPSGGHRLYSQRDVERLREVMRLKELLGVTLQELKELLTAEEARAAVRAELRRDDVHPERRRELLEQALGHLNRQLELVEHRASELAKLHEELSTTRRRVRRKLKEMEVPIMPDLSPSPEGVPGAVLDPSSIRAEDITFLGAEATPIRGYIARPAIAGAHPAMIIIHEAGGLNDHIRDVAHRFANIGYVALGVDLYTREGGPPPAGDMRAILARLFTMYDATVIGDLEGAADFLRSREDVTGKVGCIGFCMGGRYTLLFACSSDKLDAAVDCWGGFIDRATPEDLTTPERPTPPLQLAGHLRCPLFAAIGSEDQNPSPGLAERLREALEPSSHETRVKVYEGAGHAFFADYRPTYRPEPAALLWADIVPFLDKHLKDG